MKKDERVKRILKIFDEIYPDAVCTLNYETPFELLIATQKENKLLKERLTKIEELLNKQLARIYHLDFNVLNFYLNMDLLM